MPSTSADLSTRAQYRGADGFGLGLAIAHALAVAQGGRLRLEEGAPTCFVLEIPSAEVAQAS